MEIRNRAAYMVTPGKMEIRELPMPQAQPGEVVLKIEYVGVVYPVCLPNAARPLLPGIPQQSLRR